MIERTHVNLIQAKKIKRALLLIFFIATMLLSISGNAVAQQDDKQHVLILNSYHQGFSWTNRVVAGISKSFAEADSTAEFHIEYMDTKRLLNEDYLYDIFQLLEGKYANIPVELIILSDNNALEFMRTYGEQLFPGIPIVFTGINNYDDGLLEGFDQITGVAEETDIASTLSLMLRLHPETKEIYVINDQTATGIATFNAFEEIKPDFEDQVEFIVYDDFQISDMQQALATLPSDSLILMLLVNRDNSGQFYTYEESLEILSLYTEVPIYGVWDFYIEHGIVGGKLTDGFAQGRNAGEKALRILQGDAAANIPVLRESPNQYMFDFEQLERFGIDLSQLPEDSLIVNRQPSFYELYKTYIWAALSVIVSLAIVVVVLLINIRQRQRAEEALTQSFVRRGRQVELSTHVTQDIVNISDLDALYRRIVQDVKEVFGFYHAQILQYAPEIDAMRLIAGYGEIGDQMLAQGHQMQFGSGLIGQAAATGETVLRPTLADDPNWQPNPLLPDTKGEIAVPIKLGDEILGVLDVQSDLPESLSSEDQLLLEGLCGQIAVAIENTRQNQKRQAALDELQQSQKDLQERENLMHTIIDSTPNWIFVRDTEHRYKLVNKAYANSFNIHPKDMIGKNDLDIGLSEDVVKGNPEKGMRGFWPDDQAVMQSKKMKIVDVEPSVINGEQVFLNVIKSPLEDAAANVAGVVGFVQDVTKRIQADKKLEKQAQELQIVAEVSTQVATTLEQQNLLQNVVDLTKERFGLYHAHIYLLDENSKTLTLFAGAGEIGRKMVTEGRMIPLERELSLVARAARNRRGIIVNDVMTDPGFLPHALLPNTCSEMAVPMIAGDKLLGVLDVQADDANRFSEADVQIQTTLATQTAVALQNARAIEKTEQAIEQLNILTRRLTGEGWDEFMTMKSAPEFAYGYDLKQVTPLLANGSSKAETNGNLHQPIHIQGTEIGALDVGEPHTLLNEAQEITAAVTEQLITHIENLRLVEQTEYARKNAEKRNEELSLINRVMSAVTVSFDLAENMRTIAEELAKVISVSHVGIALLTEDENSLEVVTEYPPPIPGSSNDVIGQLLPIKGNLLTEQAIETRKFAIAYDAQNNALTEPIHDIMRQRRVHTLGVLPMIIGDEFFGTVGFDLLDPDRIMTDEQMKLAETVVYQATTVVQNARLFSQTQEALAETHEQARRLAILNELSETISRKQTLEEIVEAVLNKVPEMLDANRLSLHLIDETDETMLRVVGVAGEVADVNVDERIPLEDSPMADALATRQLVSGFFDTGEGTLQAYFAPLYAGGKPLGTFNMAILEEDALKEGDRQILMQIASVLGTTLENRHLFDQTRARADRERLLNKIVTQVAASLDLQHSLQIIVDEMVTALNVDQVRIGLIQPNGKELLLIAEHFDPKVPTAVGMTVPLEGNELSQEVIETRQMAVVEDAQNNPRTTPVHEMFREQGIETFVLLPLIVNDEVLGTVGLDILDDRTFDRDTLQLAETIVYQAAVAIQNANLFEQTQSALAETETLYAYSSQLNTATSLDAILDSSAAPGFEVGATDAHLLIYDQEANGTPRYGQIVAVAPNDSTPVDTKLYLPELPLSRLWPTSGQNIVFVGNVHEEDRLSQEHKTTLTKANIQAMALMFLTVGNLRLGHVVIHWDKPQTFTSADERLYGAIALQASSVVYTRLLFSQTEEALSETAALYQASADLNGAETFDQVLTTIRQHTILGQGSLNVSLNYFSDVWIKNTMPEEVLVLARWSTLPVELPNQYKLANFPEANTLLQSDDLMISEDIVEDERLSENTKQFFLNLYGAKSVIFAPIVVGGQWLGFLSGLYAEPTHFSESQIRRLNVLSRQASVSIQSIRLFEQTQEALAQTEALYTGSESIVLSTTEEDILRSLIQSTELRKLDRANFFMFDEPVEDGVPRDVTAVAIWENEGIPRTVEIGTRFSVDQVPFMNVLQSNSSMVISDVNEDPRIDEMTREILASFGMTSFVLFPMVVGNQWLGIVSGQSAKPTHMDDVHLRQANSLVGQAAVVMQTTILYRQEQARASREQLLREIATKMRGSTDVDTIMRTAVTELGRTLGRKSFIKLGNGNDENGVAK